MQHNAFFYNTGSRISYARSQFKSISLQGTNFVTDFALDLSVPLKLGCMIYRIFALLFACSNASLDIADFTLESHSG